MVDRPRSFRDDRLMIAEPMRGTTHAQPAAVPVREGQPARPPLGQIELFSVSHSHSDHVGNANLFAGATWIVDRDERDYMFSPEARANTQEFTAYERLEAARTTLIEGDGDHDVFGDGAVKIIQAPGHTPGHTVLLVTLRSGPVLSAGDLWHLAESRPARRVPVFNTDRQQTLESMDKIEGVIAETRARVVLHHVPEDFASLPRFPEPLR
jgi:glyoxylase-like metal-dependent hydrolase (beta-lactamase superfamily II)